MLPVGMLVGLATNGKGAIVYDRLISGLTWPSRKVLALITALLVREIGPVYAGELEVTAVLLVVYLMVAPTTPVLRLTVTLPT
jgi:hypothetical protein